MTKYSDGPMDEVEVIEDFLSSPMKLAFAAIRNSVNPNMIRDWGNRERGILIGSIQGALQRTAQSGMLRWPVQVPDIRQARMKFASHVFERKIESYAQLADGELDALYKFTITTNNGGRDHLRRWFEQEYPVR